MLSVYNNRIPLFSVVLCTFNRAKLLPRAINSLLVQTERDWELIVVDDGSNDNTNEIIRTFIAQYPECSIRYVFHSNRGTGLSRNAGILNSCGMYITFLDSDDEYEKEHLETRRSIILDYPEADLIHGGVKVIGNPYVADKDNPEKQVHLDECVIGGTFVVKNNVIKELGGFAALRYADDAEFFERCCREGYTVGKTDAATYIYHRETPDSLCSTQTITND